MVGGFAGNSRRFFRSLLFCLLLFLQFGLAWRRGRTSRLLLAEQSNGREQKQQERSHTPFAAPLVDTTLSFRLCLFDFLKHTKSRTGDS